MSDQREESSHSHALAGTLNRRQFLAGGGAVVAGLALPFGFGLRRMPPTCTVIGGGLAGLAAAGWLAKRGWRVVILEARDRIGGRVYSHRVQADSASLVCELGAEWVGASHERVLALCRECGLGLSDHRFQTTLLRNGQLQRAGQWGYSDAANDSFKRFRAEFLRYGTRQKRELDAIDWWTKLESIGFSPEDLRLRDLFDSTDFGESIRHVSALMAASEYFESSPANEMDFKIVGGNSRLVEELARRCDATIRTGMSVTSVTQRRGEIVIQAGAELFSSDVCICTVPTRVLSTIRFDPPLPDAQRRAASSLQYARIVKSSVLFTERFWSDDDYSLLSDETTHYYFHSTKGQQATAGILTSYTIGDKADVLAARDDTRTVDLVASDLTHVDPRAKSLARGVYKYAWQRDRFTGGAYALYRPGQWYGVRPVLARPHGKVLFAGEHLADWQGFMEGAIVTGEEAAARLLD